MMARVLGEEMGKLLRQQFIVENKPGAGSMLGTQAVASSPADGCTLLLADTPFTTVPALYGDKVKYQNEKDFTPISLLGTSPIYLFVNALMPTRTVSDLVRSSQSGSGAAAIGSGGVGSLTHLMSAMLVAGTGANLSHVPYKGAAAAMTDLAAGQIQAQFAALASASGFVSGGRIRPIAVTGVERTKELPTVPTLAESGVPGFDLEIWWALLAPAGVAPDLQARLHRAVQQVLAMPQVRTRLQAAGVTIPPDLSAAAVTGLIRKDNVRWRSVVEKAQIRVE